MRPADVLSYDVTRRNVVSLQVVHLSLVNPHVLEVTILRTNRVSVQNVNIHVGVIQIDVVDSWIQRQLILRWVEHAWSQVPVQH